MSMDTTNTIIKTEHLRFFYGFCGVPTTAIFDEEKTNELHQLFRQLRQGEYRNTSENQKITHHQLRVSDTPQWMNDLHTLDQTITRDGLSTICHIGIGGSIMGPECIYHSLSTWNTPQQRSGIFISSHDEDHINAKLKGIDIERTLFVIVSKSGKTIEIQKILDTIAQKQRHSTADFLRHQCVSITTSAANLTPNHYRQLVLFDSGVGGRFSTTSPVGLVTLGLCFGPPVIPAILQGARCADKHAQSVSENIALRQAMIRFYQQQTYAGHAIVPYGEALVKFAPFLIQLICESLGKGSTIHNQPSLNQHAPILMHGIGPDAQHTFFQQLHQGTPIIPVEFFMTSPKTPNQTHILQQIIGQSLALHHGQQSHTPHHYFSGHRPSCITLLNHRSPEALGYLVGVIENRIMFEGFLHHINTFDQPGVELGKKMTKKEMTPNSAGTTLFNQLMH
jgi:glucose-6-phosphate isomerase